MFLRVLFPRLAWYQGPDWELRFDSQGFGHVCKEGTQPRPLRALFQLKVGSLTEAFASLVVEPPGEEASALPPLMVAPARYCSCPVPNDASQSLQSWEQGQYTLGLRTWWCLGDLVSLFHPQCQPEAVPKYMTNTWSRWLKHVAFCGPTELLMQPGIDRSGKAKHFRRLVAERTVSTTGALALMVSHQCLLRVPAPPLVRTALDSFLRCLLKTEEYELHLPLDRELCDAYSAAGCGCPLELCETLVLLGTRMPIEPFLSQTEGNEHAHLDALFADLRAQGNVSEDTVELATLLPSLFQRRNLQWLCRGLIHQVARTMDGFRDAADFSENPLDHDRLWGGGPTQRWATTWPRALALTPRRNQPPWWMPTTAPS